MISVEIVQFWEYYRGNEGLLIWVLCAAVALSIFTLDVRSDTSHGRNSWAVVTLIKYSITVSLQTHNKDEEKVMESAENCAVNPLTESLKQYNLPLHEYYHTSTSHSFTQIRCKRLLVLCAFTTTEIDLSWFQLYCEEARSFTAASLVWKWVLILLLQTWEI